MIKPATPGALPTALLTLLLAAALLTGCATGLDANQCRSADWRTIGYEDGLHGRPPDRIGAHRVACAKHQVAPDLAAYSDGRERGLLQYCQPRNGFRAGLAGQLYANVCPMAGERPFLDAYRSGRQIHDARADLRGTRSRLQGARSNLEKTDAAVQSATLELVSPQASTERRLALAQELVRLAEQRKEIEARIDDLARRASVLAIDLRELERLSPYPL